MENKNKGFDLDSLILNFLKDNGDYVTGDELSVKFKISRRRVYDHISNLTAKGYDIAAVPHSGYKLISCPDKLYPWEIMYKLGTEVLGRDIRYYKAVDSTQNIAWEAGLNGAPEGLLVVSEIQKKGRGRMDRRWISPPGGVYCSLLLRPAFLNIHEIPQIALLIALGCLQGIRRVTGVECSLKWPNDILLEGKKLGGILCEVNAEMNKAHFVVAGIGINVNTRDLFPEADSLFFHTGTVVSRVEILKKNLEEIERLYKCAMAEGFSTILKDWEKSCDLWGQRLRINISGRELEGEACGIDEKGYLLLRNNSGFIEKISAGDVIKLNVNKPKKAGK